MDRYSTPIHMRKSRHRSPSISTITSFSGSTRSNDSSIEESFESLSSSIAVDSPATTNFEDFALTISRRGLAAKLFKAKRYDSIYAELIRQPSEIRIHVQVWKDTYDTSKSTAMSDLLQLFIDVMGFQDFHIIDFYNGRNTNFDEIITKMEASYTKLHEAKHWVLKLKSNFAKDFWKVFQSFLYELIKTCHLYDILYEPDFFEGLVGFFKEAVTSKFLVIRYNILLIGIKICSMLVKIATLIETKYMESSHTSEMSEASGELTEKERFNLLSNTINFFILTTTKMGRVDDPGMELVYVLCLKEIAFWISKNCKLVLSNQNLLLVYLNFNIEHCQPSVRIATIYSYTLMLKSDGFIEYIKKYKRSMSVFFNNIAKRFKDVDRKVRSAAFHFYTICVDRYPLAITSDVRSHILTHLVAKNHFLYRASALFCTAYLSKFDSKLNLVQFLIKLANYDEFKNKMGLFVESLIEHNEILTELDWIVKIVSDISDSPNLIEDDEETLLQLVYHISYHMIHGKSEFSRKTPLQDYDFAYNKQYVMDEIIPKIPILFHKFSHSNDCLQFVIKISLLMDFETDDIARLSVAIERIMDILFSCMDSCDAPLLDLIGKLLFQLTMDECPLQEDATALSIGYIVPIINRCENFHLKFNRTSILNESEMNLLTQFEADINCLSILSEHYDFTAEIDWSLVYGNWNVLGNENDLNIKIIQDQIKFCSNYLKWQLKAVVANQNNDPHNVIKVKLSNVYVKLFEMMKNSNKDEFEAAIFSHLTKLCQDIAAIRKEHPNMADLEYNPLQEQDVMIRTFVIRYCFKNDHPTKYHHEVFEDFIKYSFSGYVDAFDLKYIFQYYLLSNQIYDDLFEQMIKTLFTKYGGESMSAIVLDSVFHMARSGPRTHTHFITRSKELGLAFMNLLPKNIFAKLIEMALGYISMDISSVILLQCLYPFTKHLTRNEQMKLCDIVHSLYAKPLHKEVLKFLMFVRPKPFKVKRRSQKPGPEEPPSPVEQTPRRRRVAGRI